VVAWGDNSEGQCNVPADASNSVVAVSGGYSHSLAIRGIQELPEVRTPAIWLPANGIIYFGTTNNYIKDMDGTNFLFRCGDSEKMMLP
ncbi:MAG TPA: RCC1 domain-containing protein, partial [Candidatus Sumerlaeota bacterium]|nr:RCC1 domain-containing protein [Candidatus Sumerlaeota bacterium]